MTSAHPPRIAVWLLHHFGSSPNNESVIGDLTERYRQGRSRAWYWTQVLKAIVVSLAQEVSTHKLLTVGGVATGWSLVLVGMFLFHALVASLNRAIHADSATASTLEKVVRNAAIFHPNISLLVLVAVSCLGWTGIGWILKMLFRPQEKPLVLTFVTTVLAAVIYPVASSLIVYRSPFVLIGVSGNVIGLLCVLMGAGLLRSQRPLQPSFPSQR